MESKWFRSKARMRAKIRLLAEKAVGKGYRTFFS